ncbi:MAG: 4'-phosphopantetheinyl transferase superfamily protein, partial [Terasakiella sp.]|nr:4'-phosphopantetheinyl transferase superfamily protein [Terasakiella sp.]
AAGAPVLEGSRLHISISHSARMAAVAIDPARRIGIDIEDLDRGRQIERVAPRVLSAAELESYTGRLLEAWTLKEALYKIADDPGIDWRASLPIPPALPSRLIHTGREGDSWLSVVARPV